MPKRCALGCPFDPKIPYHTFPNSKKNLDRFKVWVRIVGGKLESDNDYEHYRKKVICDVHFPKQSKNRNKRLNTLAVPTLHLPGVPVFLETNIVDEHDYCLREASLPDEVASTFKEDSQIITELFENASLPEEVASTFEEDTQITESYENDVDAICNENQNLSGNQIMNELEDLTTACSDIYEKYKQLGQTKNGLSKDLLELQQRITLLRQLVDSTDNECISHTCESSTSNGTSSTKIAQLNICGMCRSCEK